MLVSRLLQRHVDEKGLLKAGSPMTACTLVSRYKLMAPLAEAAIHNVLEAPNLETFLLPQAL